MDAADVLQECYVYENSVAFFVVFHKHLGSLGTRVEVEHDFDSPTGVKRVPDFAILEGEQIVEVVEHKGSLPSSNEYASKEVNSAAKKYSNLIHEGTSARPRISVVYPIKSQVRINKIRDTVDSTIGLYSFDQSSSETELSFTLDRGPESPLLSRLIADGPIVYDPVLARSRFKYLRAEPPLILVAINLWAVLSTFKTMADVGKASFQVNLNSLREVHAAFYPPWIRNNLQLNSSRLTRALAFLARLEFVEVHRGGSVTVFPERGSRSGELGQYFANKFASIAGGRASGTTAKRAQLSLDAFLKTQPDFARRLEEPHSQGRPRVLASSPAPRSFPPREEERP
jgi:hypothetical protein